MRVEPSAIGLMFSEKGQERVTSLCLCSERAKPED